jgi:hypothetical protein
MVHVAQMMVFCFVQGLLDVVEELDASIIGVTEFGSGRC